MLERIYKVVLAGDAEGALSLTEEALNAGIPPEQILNEGLISAMDIVGREYEEGIRFIPEMLISAEAMKSAMQALRPHLVKAGVEPRGRVVIGTVDGDLHDIGKDLVAMMLEGAGFEVINLGVEVAAEEFVEAVRTHHPDILAMSALLTTTMVNMPKVIDALRKAGLRGQVKVIVGGAPVTEEFAAQIGADGYADDAAAAVNLAKALV